jgi:hypothetical protein
MISADFLKPLQRFVANVGITASSLRNQGAEGVVAVARNFLAELDLGRLATIELTEYPAWLEQNTTALMVVLPEGARRWGAARKAMNIMTTQSFLNGRLAASYRLDRLGDVMETPLDGIAAAELRKMEGGKWLPNWKGVGALTPEVSARYQGFALDVAQAKGIPRAFLDVFLWRPAPA